MADIFDTQLRTKINKTSTENLSRELLIAQDYLDDKQINNLTRGQVVLYIYLLRKAQNQLQPITGLVSNVDFKEAFNVRAGLDDVFLDSGADSIFASRKSDSDLALRTD